MYRRGKTSLSLSDDPQFPQPDGNQEPHFVPLSSSSTPDVPPPVAPAPVPPPDPVWNGWDVLVIAALTLVMTAIVPFATGAIARLFFYPRMTVIEILQQQSTVLLISQLLIDAAWPILILLWIEGKYQSNFWHAIHWNWPRAAWMMLALGAVTFVGLALVGNLLPMPKETPFDKLFDRTRDAYLLAIIAVTVAPFAEEMFFRGFLYPPLARRLGAGWGVFLAALPFALMHLPQYGFSVGIFLVILGVGVVCGIVRAATKSVGASFLVHAGYNGAQMVLAVILTRGFTRMPKGLLDLAW